MDVKSCRRCKRLFNYISGQQLCPACKEELEAKFQEVKDFLYKNKFATIRDVAKECDVDEHQIKQWIREERLEFSEGIASGITCEICGIMIPTGRYCEKCKASMIKNLESVGRKPVQETKQQPSRQTHENKMRFLNQK